MRKDTCYFLIYKKYLSKINKSSSPPSHRPIASIITLLPSIASPSRGREKLPVRFADDYRFFEPS